MIDFLNELTRLNRNLKLDDDLEGFTVSPSLQNENVELLALLHANKDRILDLLIDSHKLITAIEMCASDDPKKWQAVFNRFRKDYAPVPYIEDAYDDLISWLNANQKLTSAGEKIKKLQARRNSTVAIKARQTDMSAYKRIAVRQREKLVPALLTHTDLYGQITKYMDNHGKKKEKVASS